MKVPLGGGTPTVLVSGLVAPHAMAVDATNAYWTSGVGTDANGVGNGEVMKVPLAGGTPTTLASGLSFAGAIAVDATSVYWTNALGVGAGVETGGTSDAVMTVLLGGGAPMTLASSHLRPPLPSTPPASTGRTTKAVR